MAIPFLNNIDLSDNELQNVKLHITGTAPAAEAAQIYYNSGNNTARYYNGTTWVELVASTGGTVTSVATTHAGDAFTSSIGGVATINPSVDVTANGSALQYVNGLGNLVLLSTIPQGDITDVNSGTYITTTNSTGPIVTVNHNLTTRTDTASAASPGYGATFTAVDSVTTNTTGHVTALNLKTVTIPAADDTNTTYTLPVSAGTAVAGHTVADIDLTAGGSGSGIASKVTIAGKDNNIAVTETAGNNGVVNIALSTNIEVAGTGSFVGQVTIPITPIATTHATSKNYVDSSIAGSGALIYQGAYNATTNTPNLDTVTNIAINKGFTYTVTVDGLFFTEQVRVGDLIIANVNIPANSATNALANWTTVQNNADLADATTIGIGNVVPGSSNTITAPYTSGTATLDVVNSTASQKGAVIVAGGAGISVAYVAGTATVTNTETNASNTFAATISVSGAVTHSLGTKDVIVQLYDTVTNETVYTDVDRNLTSQVTVTFASAPTNPVRVLVQKIG